MDGDEFVLLICFMVGILACIGLGLTSIGLVMSTWRRHKMVDRIAWQMAVMQVQNERRQENPGWHARHGIPHRRTNRPVRDTTK